MDYHNPPPGKDAQLWQLAHKRAAFKRHLVTYLIVNAFLWIIWYFTGERTSGQQIPWPAWSTAGWGIGLFFHYASAYLTTGNNSVEKEYEKLNKQIKQ